MLTRRKFLGVSVAAGVVPASLAIPGGVSAAVRPRLNYNAANAIAYAKKWSPRGNDCPDGEYDKNNWTDCAHFISHVLKAGNVFPNAQDGLYCRSGLLVRAADLLSWFTNATGRFSNVSSIAPAASARAGDYCFMFLNGGQRHVVLLAGQPKTTGSRGMAFYAHSKNRTGNFVSEKDGNYKLENCMFYRIS
ncbi:MAG: amidase domain-containing protein [Pirellulaceae bacterium]